MHEKKILHGDLNIENLLICPRTYDFKIIDFGLAINLEKNEIVFNDRGNLNYRICDSEFSFEDPLRIDYWGFLLILLSCHYQQNITSKKALQIIKNRSNDSVENRYFSLTLEKFKA